MQKSIPIAIGTQRAQRMREVSRRFFELLSAYLMIKIFQSGPEIFV